MPDPCVKCGGGSFYLDEALGEAVMVRASVCRTCGTRIELDPQGQAWKSCNQLAGRTR